MPQKIKLGNQKLNCSVVEPEPQPFAFAKPESECFRFLNRFGSGSIIKWNIVQKYKSKISQK
jgi:hypothetical protein